MQSYTKKRFKARGVDPYFSMPLCQICRKQKIQDIHHIFGRSGNRLNDIFNLIALCVDCHQSIHLRVKNDFDYRQKLLDFIENDLKKYGIVKQENKKDKKDLKNKNKCV